MSTVYMLCPRMELGVVANSDGGLVVHTHLHRQGWRQPELRKEFRKKDTFLCGLGGGHDFCLARRKSNRVLFLGSPADNGGRISKLPSRRRVAHSPVRVTLPAERQSISLKAEPGMTMSVQVSEYTLGVKVELFSGLRHRTTKQSDRESHVGTSVARTVQESTH